MTIYALSSGPGIAGVAVIRVSGEDTEKVIKLITGKDLPVPRVATLRKINNINTNELIDEGIVIWFPGPQSYTGEDMAEFHVHGSRAVIEAIHGSISKIENWNCYVINVFCFSMSTNYLLIKCFFTKYWTICFSNN